MITLSEECKSLMDATLKRVLDNVVIARWVDSEGKTLSEVKATSELLPDRQIRLMLDDTAVPHGAVKIQFIDSSGVILVEHNLELQWGQ
jgi:hypothetical protein